jgi:hypothetical protein
VGKIAVTASVLEQMIAKGITYEEAVVVELQDWSKVVELRCIMSLQKTNQVIFSSSSLPTR